MPGGVQVQDYQYQAFIVFGHFAEFGTIEHEIVSFLCHGHKNSEYYSLPRKYLINSTIIRTML